MREHWKFYANISTHSYLGLHLESQSISCGPGMILVHLRNRHLLQAMRPCPCAYSRRYQAQHCCALLAAGLRSCHLATLTGAKRY